MNMYIEMNMFPRSPGFARTQTTHPNNMIYFSPEDEWKHWLYSVILTLSFQDLGFSFRVLGFRLLGFVVLESKELKPYGPTQGFEHVKG